MTDLKLSLMCAKTSMRKWIGNKRIYTVALIMIAFSFYTFTGLSQFAGEVGVAVAPWVMPFFLSFPVMVVVFGCATTLLFCNAPFTDNQMPFLIIRTGRRNFILGQLLYIAAASFLFVLLILVSSVASLIPHLTFSSDWGTVLKTIANDQMAPSAYGIELPFSVLSGFIEYFTPLQAVLTSFFFLWLTTVFMGMTITFFNVVMGRLSGLIAAGLITFMSYFSFYLGSISFGSKIIFFSPLSWSNVYILDFTMGGENYPSPEYAGIVLGVLIIVMAVITVKVFCTKDMEYQEWRD